jgi:hypothetical protein
MSKIDSYELKLRALLEKGGNISIQELEKFIGELRDVYRGEQRRLLKKYCDGATTEQSAVIAYYNGQASAYQTALDLIKHSELDFFACLDKLEKNIKEKQK